MGKLKILLFAMDGQGHVNAILGLAGILSKAGHEIVITLSKGWEPLISSKGFQFVPLDMEPVGGQAPEEETAEKGQDGKEKKSHSVKTFLFIEKMLKSFRHDPIEALENFESENKQIYLDWSDTMLAFDQPLERVINDLKPDIIIVDFLIRLSCLLKGSIPWVSLWSCSPVALYRGFCPPEGTGFALDSPRELWNKFYSLFAEKLKPIRDKVNNKLIEAGVEPYTEYESLYLFKSPYLNVYVYPESLDYTDIAPRPDKCFRMDAVIREPDDATPFTLPDNLVDKPGALIYFSLGSMGSVDLELMRRVISVLAKSPHRFIISKGPYHDQIDLPDNCWGEKYVNQIAILPHCDLVITHGGNNTLTESLYFGKPLIVMPLFYDQLDNAQRIVDKQLGVRLDTYRFTDDQLLTAIEKLVHDEKLYSELEKISFAIKNTKSREQIVELIEQTAITKKSPE
ncbi:NDP-glycosyltransferase YjiC-like [Panonychus citri]|uniref:NDP-glycosyltransferase YjiC-like n=1 Tax=Panonychus citri TaxID=50023 RepID=UPI002306DD6A|nr:NDP-glycosyltransferase YjiC-like [Panonychus citri]